MLKKQIDHLLVKLERERKARALPDLSENILHLAREHGRISISCISNALGANRNTVKKHVQQLVRNGQLVSHGKAGAPIILPFDMDYETICQYYIDLQNRAQYSWDAEGAKRAYRTKCAPIWQ
jgi:predicted transcriptional regulator